MWRHRHICSCPSVVWKCGVDAVFDRNAFWSNSPTSANLIECRDVAVFGIGYPPPQMSRRRDIPNGYAKRATSHDVLCLHALCTSASLSIAAAKSAARIGVLKIGRTHRRKAVFLCLQHGKSVMGGPCGAAQAAPEPDPGTPTCTVPLTLIGVRACGV